MRLKSRRNKGYKIKKYDRIFDSSSRRKKKKIRNTVIFVVILLLLVFVGYSISGPLINLLKGEKTERPGESSSQISSAGQGDLNSSSITSSEQPNISETELFAAYLSLETAKNPVTLGTFLDNIKSKGYNAVVLQLKDETGNIYYQSGVEMAKTVGAVSPTAVLDISQIVTQIKQASVTPIAQIHAFKDRIGTKNSAAKIKYANNDSWSWLDAQNGKPWLNPYSAEAQKYITDISLELAGAGFERVMVSSVMFPNVYSFSLANFGPLEATVSHKDILVQFTASLKTALNDKGAKLLLEYDAAAAANAENVIYGAADPKTFAADTYVAAVGADYLANQPSDNTSSQSASKLETLVSQAALSKTTLMVEVQADALSSEQIEYVKTACKDCALYFANKTANY